MTESDAAESRPSMDPTNSTSPPYQPACRPFSLPPEIRIEIYELAFLDYGTNWDLVLTPRDARKPPLTQTCSTLRRETLPIIYSNYRYVFAILDSKSLHAAYSWVAAIGDHNVARMQNIMAVGFDARLRQLTLYTNLRSFALNRRSLQTETDEHRAWMITMLDRMRTDAQGKAATSRLLCKLLASFAQKCWNHEDRQYGIGLDDLVNVSYSGLYGGENS